MPKSKSRACQDKDTSKKVLCTTITEQVNGAAETLFSRVVAGLYGYVGKKDLMCSY